MVLAGFAFSGVSAHAWSHPRGCRVSLGGENKPPPHLSLHCDGQTIKW